MDVSVVMGLIVTAIFLGLLITLHFWGRNEPTQEEAVTQEVIVRALTGPVPASAAHARLTLPNSQAGTEGDNDKEA